MAKYEKVLRHPDLNEVLELLIRKEKGLRAIQDMFKRRYPNEPQYHLSETTLRKFMTEGVGIVRDKANEAELRAAVTDFLKNMEPLSPPKEALPPVPVAPYELHNYQELAMDISEEAGAGMQAVHSLLIDTIETTRVILEEVKEHERDVRDFKQMTSACKDVADIYQVLAKLNVKTDAQQEDNSYEAFLALEDEEGAADES